MVVVEKDRVRPSDEEDLRRALLDIATTCSENWARIDSSPPPPGSEEQGTPPSLESTFINHHSSFGQKTTIICFWLPFQYRRWGGQSPTKNFPVSQGVTLNISPSSVGSVPLLLLNVAKRTQRLREVPHIVRELVTDDLLSICGFLIIRRPQLNRYLP